jgi:hypothetical protein
MPENETTPVRPEFLEQLQAEIKTRDEIMIEVGIMIIDLTEAIGLKEISEKFKDKAGNPREPSQLELMGLMPKLLSNLPMLLKVLDKEKMAPLFEKISNLYGTQINERRNQRKYAAAALAALGK